MNFKQKEEAAQSTVTPNQTGIPTQMKQQYEQLSHFLFDDVRVHYNSDKPAQLQALAYTQGSHVYIGPGQEQHLGHELGHVVQQKQGLVRPTTVVAGLPLNDNRQLESQADNLHSFAKSLALLPVNPQVGNIVQRHEADPYTRQAEPKTETNTSGKAIPYMGYEWRTVEAGEEDDVLKDRSEAFAGSRKINKEQDNKERIKDKMVPSLYSPKILPS